MTPEQEASRGKGTRETPTAMKIAAITVFVAYGGAIAVRFLERLERLRKKISDRSLREATVEAEGERIIPPDLSSLQGLAAMPQPPDLSVFERLTVILPSVSELSEIQRRTRRRTRNRALRDFALVTIAVAGIPGLLLGLRGFGDEYDPEARQAEAQEALEKTRERREEREQEKEREQKEKRISGIRSAAY
ncbi:MAG: hypothetical protein AAB840_01535, partial [Patescibacteria group bacterium]